LLFQFFFEKKTFYQNKKVEAISGGNFLSNGNVEGLINHWFKPLLLLICLKQKIVERLVRH
jgi:hypothetical protein